ncbi:hypothetical protein O1611_g6118 [Lasiodiplodia mahajangana]|uniref:Uncharacterized protein n=1 Tax=Lasiodiplodia mahajangana TaxID=1108764 RepID=A0ACC2JJ82_9PEZI|nr:hypothetical protein O1611_g6118 [Lasiodiplodia mahajangana]
MTPVPPLSEQHIHIRLIDTPGLDNSDNIQHESLAAEGTKTGSEVRVVNEQHKLDVSETISQEGRVHTVLLHTVFFAMSNSVPRKNRDTKSLPQEYMDIFKLYSLARSFHFAHTKLDVTTIFDKVAVTRPGEDDKLFRLHGVAKHHPIDSLPLDEEPTIKEAIMNRQRGIRAEIVKTESEISGKRGLLGSLQNGASSDKKKVDTEELEELTSQSRSDQTRFFSDSVVVVVSGTVTVFVYKKEGTADEVQARSKENEAYEDYLAIMSKITATEEEIKKLDEGTKTREAQLDALNASLESLDKISVGMEAIKNRGEYLASTSVISYCYGIGLQHALPRGDLPDGSQFASYYGNVDAKYRSSREESEQIFSTAKRLLE